MKAISTFHLIILNIYLISFVVCLATNSYTVNFNSQTRELKDKSKAILNATLFLFSIAPGINSYFAIIGLYDLIISVPRYKRIVKKHWSATKLLKKNDESYLDFDYCKLSKEELIEGLESFNLMDDEELIYELNETSIIHLKQISKSSEHKEVKEKACNQLDYLAELAAKIQSFEILI